MNAAQVPQDIPPSELFMKLLERPSPSEVFDFPAKLPGGTPLPRVRIHVLRMELHDRARIQARDFLKSKRKMTDADLATELGRELLGDAVARELIAVAVTTENSIGDDGKGAPIYGRVFRNADDVNMLTADEVLILFNAYMLVQAKYGPFEMIAGTKEDQDAWIARLQEGAAAAPLLLRLPLPRLVELTSSLGQRTYSLCRILVSQWESLPTSLRSDLERFCLDTSYFGEQLDDSTPISSLENLGDLTIEQATRMTQGQKVSSGA